MDCKQLCSRILQHARQIESREHRIEAMEAREVRGRSYWSLSKFWQHKVSVKLSSATLDLEHNLLQNFGSHFPELWL